MSELFKYSIYVNASPERLRGASRGSEPSLPIVEKKRCARGQKLLAEARRRGEELPLVFAHFAPLTFWAVAREIKLQGNKTEYRFANLRPLRGYRRRDLVVDSTSSRLPDEFIRSYALIRTPDFLSPGEDGDDADSMIEEPEELVGLEGELRLRMSAHRRREGALRAAKLADGLRRGKGSLKCEVPGCGFDFSQAYGALGSGYAHVHHLRPLAEYGGVAKTTLDDLAIICANCHAMVHRGGECRGLEDLIDAHPPPTNGCNSRRR